MAPWRSSAALLARTPIRISDVQRQTETWLRRNSCTLLKKLQPVLSRTHCSFACQQHFTRQRFPAQATQTQRQAWPGLTPTPFCSRRHASYSSLFMHSVSHFAIDETASRIVSTVSDVVGVVFKLSKSKHTDVRRQVPARQCQRQLPSGSEKSDQPTGFGSRHVGKTAQSRPATQPAPGRCRSAPTKEPLGVRDLLKPLRCVSSRACAFCLRRLPFDPLMLRMQQKHAAQRRASNSPHRCLALCPHPI